jgi:hypothetical protein
VIIASAANASAAAIAAATQPNAQPYLGSSHFFFDGVHLDTKPLQVQANFALAALPVPEPSRGALLVAAVLAMRARAGRLR